MSLKEGVVRPDERSGGLKDSDMTIGLDLFELNEREHWRYETRVGYEVVAQMKVSGCFIPFNAPPWGPAHSCAPCDMDTLYLEPRVGPLMGLVSLNRALHT